MIDIGWVKTPRTLLSGSLWKTDEPFDTRSAYIDLTLMASFAEDNFTPKHSRKNYKILPGQLVISYDSLSKRWKWDRKTVIRYLKWIEGQGLISRKTYTWGTILTIEKYGENDNQGTTKGTTLGTTIGTAPRTSTGTTLGTTIGTRYKKDKNIKNNENKKNKESAKRRLNLWEGDPE